MPHKGHTYNYVIIGIIDKKKAISSHQPQIPAFSKFLAHQSSRSMKAVGATAPSLLLLCQSSCCLDVSQSSHGFLLLDFLNQLIYRVFIKKLFLFQSTATHPLHVEEQLICTRDMISLLLAGHCLYNQQRPSAGEGEVAIYGLFLEKPQYLMNTPQLKSKLFE